MSGSPEFYAQKKRAAQAGAAKRKAKRDAALAASNDDTHKDADAQPSRLLSEHDNAQREDTSADASHREDTRTHDATRDPLPPAAEGGVTSSATPHNSEPQNEVSSRHDEGRDEKKSDSGNACNTASVPPIASSVTSKVDEKTGKKKAVWNVSLSPRQAEALNSEDPVLLYGGAKGGGKSWFLCVWSFIMALKFPGNKIFLCRRRSVDFTNTTLETWRKAIPARFYRINEQKKKIYVIPSKSVIDYGGLDDPLTIQSLNSAEYAQVGVDQAEEVDMDSVAMLRGTLRHRLPDGSFPPYRVRLTANPAQCWLKEAFLGHPPRPGHRFITALPSDNPYLPKDYVSNLEEAFRHRPALLAAYLRGSWDDLSGNNTCIRGTHIEEAKTRRRPDGPVIKRIVVNDPAITGDRNVTYLMEQVGNVKYIADRYVIEHKRPLETAALLAAYRKRMKANLIALDKIGIGEGVVDGLIALDEPYLAINSAAAPTNLMAAKRYGNLRAQMWWEAGDAFAQNFIMLSPQDIELCRQLGLIKFNQEKLVKLFVESKAEIKTSLGHSPDEADAFIMGLYALDQAPRLDERQVLDSETDRVGHGIPIQENVQDFSGYSMAQAEEEQYGYPR